MMMINIGPTVLDFCVVLRSLVHTDVKKLGSKIVLNECLLDMVRLWLGSAFFISDPRPTSTKFQFLKYITIMCEASLVSRSPYNDLNAMQPMTWVVDGVGNIP